MAAWYIDDGDIKRYSVHKNMLQTETYTKLSLLSEAVKNNANIEVIDVAVTPKYKMRLVLVTLRADGRNFLNNRSLM